MASNKPSNAAIMLRVMSSLPSTATNVSARNASTKISDGPKNSTTFCRMGNNSARATAPKVAPRKQAVSAAPAAIAP